MINNGLMQLKLVLNVLLDVHQLLPTESALVYSQIVPLTQFQYGYVIKVHTNADIAPVLVARIC